MPSPASVSQFLGSDPIELGGRKGFVEVLQMFDNPILKRNGTVIQPNNFIDVLTEMLSITQLYLSPKWPGGLLNTVSILKVTVADVDDLVFAFGCRVFLLRRSLWRLHSLSSLALLWMCCGAGVPCGAHSPEVPTCVVVLASFLSLFLSLICFAVCPLRALMK